MAFQYKRRHPCYFRCGEQLTTKTWTSSLLCEGKKQHCFLEEDTQYLEVTLPKDVTLEDLPPPEEEFVGN
jgi:hypothetical protein